LCDNYDYKLSEKPLKFPPETIEKFIPDWSVCTAFVENTTLVPPDTIRNMEPTSFLGLCQMEEAEDERNHPGLAVLRRNEDAIGQGLLEGVLKRCSESLLLFVRESFG
jgi:hypothetical protein